MACRKTRGRHWQSMLKEKSIRWQPLVGVNSLSTPHFPVLVSRPSSATLNHLRPEPSLVEASSTLAMYAMTGPLCEAAIGSSPSPAVGPARLWFHCMPNLSPGATSITSLLTGEVSGELHAIAGEVTSWIGEFDCGALTPKRWPCDLPFT